LAGRFVAKLLALFGLLVVWFVGWLAGWLKLVGQLVGWLVP